jgi:opacity protein-like surface antigen
LCLWGFETSHPKRLALTVIGAFQFERVKYAVLDPMIGCGGHVQSLGSKTVGCFLWMTVSNPGHHDFSWWLYCIINKGNENMKNTFKIFTFTTALMLSMPAMAKDGYYMSGHIGGTYLTDGDNSGSLLSIESEYNAGFNVGGTIGYEFHPALSVEAELSYRYNGVDGLNVTNFPSFPAANGTSIGASGHVSALSAMVNAKSSLSALQGRDNANGGLYVMGGIGFAEVNAEIDSSGTQVVDDSDVVFAYQAGVGYDIPLDNGLSIDLGYRYFGTSDVSLDDTDGDPFDAEYDSHNVMVGLVKKF